MLNVEGDQIVRVVADGTAREGANADQSAAAHAAYRTAVTELVEAARKAREHGQASVAPHNCAVTAP
jgi:hypothetical protein